MEKLRNYLRTIVNLLKELKEAELNSAAAIPTKERIIESTLVSPAVGVVQIGTILNAGTLREIRMNVKGTTPSIGVAVRRGTSRTAGTTDLLTTRTITSETTDDVFLANNFASDGLIDRNQITLDLSSITGTVDELYICLIYEND